MSPDPHEEDRKLVARCLAGEPGAWETFVRAHGVTVRAASRRTLQAYRVSPDESRLDDLCQETLARVVAHDFAALKRFRWECPLPHYLASLAVSRTLNHLRYGRPEYSARMLEARRALWAEVVRREAAPAGTAEERPLDSLHKALERLPSRERAALKLFYWDGAPALRIAALLGLRPGYVRILLHRARSRLKGLLQDALCF